MDSAHIIELLIMVGLGLVGFIGLRVHKAIDTLFIKLDEFELRYNERCNEVTKRLNMHAERITRLEATIKHYHRDAKI